jgi:glycerophosphoryl diester phosphodiesterase
VGGKAAAGRPGTGSGRYTGGGSYIEKQVSRAVLSAPVQCIAHRGFAGVYPENTLAAVLGAAGDGADAVEVDVRRCGSGEVVVCHDASVGRVTDGTGAVSNLSRTDLARLDVLGSGEGIPTLRAVVDRLPAGVGLNVELKEPAVAADVLRILAEGADRRDWWLSSFDREALAVARDAATDLGDAVQRPVPTALLVTGETVDPVAAARECQCRALHPESDVCTPDLVAAAHEAGLAVNAWTVRSESTACRLVRAGVDGLIADAPEQCLRGSRGSGEA